MCLENDVPTLYVYNGRKWEKLEKEGDLSIQQEQPDDLASLISEATNVAKRIVDMGSFHNSLPQNLRNKYTFKAWCEILEALSTMKGQEQPEVDLEKEYTEFVESDPVYSKLVNGIVGKSIARHFYELGKNSK